MILTHGQHIWLREEGYRCLAGSGVIQAGKTHVQLLLLQTLLEFLAWTLKQFDLDIGMRLPECVEHTDHMNGREPTPARTYDEVEATKKMLDRTERRFDLKPKRLAADTACGTGRFLGWLVGHRITPHIPVRDASDRADGTFSRSDFRWDRRRGVYICPNDKVLHTTGTVHDGQMLRYRASKFDCDTCTLKIKCCPNTPARQIPRDINEYAGTWRAG
jgi:hypothetical protein